MAAVGDKVASYVITGVIGRGAMASVFRAHDERLNRDVALKLLDPGYSLDFIFRARFERESRVTAQIHNDHIVPVYDAGQWEDQLYIAMALIDGPNLGEVMRAEAPLELGRVVSIVTQVADALDEAHRHRVIHRDVKPANILLARHSAGAAEHAYLADFGLTLGMEGTHLTRTGGFMGTLAYSSPEQLTSAPIDGRADEYALAATTFQMLTGELPFKRDNEMALINAHMFDPPPRVSDARQDLPPRISDVIARGMAKRPEDRYSSAGEFARKLSAASASASGAVIVPRTSSRIRAVAILFGLIAAAGVGGAVTLAVLSGVAHPATSLPPPTTPLVAESTPTLAPTPSPPLTSAAPTLPPTPSPSPTPSRTPKGPPPTPPPTRPPTPTPTRPPTPTPTPTPPPANLPLVADGTWSVDNTPTGVSGDPYVVVGEHRRRYEITSHCASEADCRLAVDTFDSDGHRLGSITFKWNGAAYVYRGGASWYDKAGGSSCQTSSGDVVANAYATHEEVHVAPPSGSGSGAATHMTGTKTISGTPTAAGMAAGCGAFEMDYSVDMNSTG